MPRGQSDKPASPLQRAQRDRQSVIFSISGAVGNILNSHIRANPQLFTELETKAIQDLAKAANNWKFVCENQNRWEEVKQNLANSVDKAQEKV